jgi:ABC-type multidrug transport system ATPase subunit
MLLELKNVSKNYGDKKAVDNVSLTLKPGIYGLLGANGAGKTTLMNVICGVIKANAGKIFIDGNQISTVSESYRELLGYNPQEFGYDKVFNVKEYLEYMAALKGLSVNESKQRIEKLIELLNLGKYKKKKVCKLSGGTGRRVGIAQALLNNPKILILDEPSAGLDPGERIRLRKIISNLSKDKIIILSTHIVSDIENISNNNLIMKSGKIVADGDAEHLLTFVKDKVFSTTCKEDEIDNLPSSLKVINTYFGGNGLVNVRYISETPLPSSQKEDPTLEDVYFWFFREEEKQQVKLS